MSSPGERLKFTLKVVMIWPWKSETKFSSIYKTEIFKYALYFRTVLYL